MMSFFFNPFARAHINAELLAVFDSNEKQKNAAYNQRVIDIEHGSFTRQSFSLHTVDSGGKQRGSFQSR